MALSDNRTSVTFDLDNDLIEAINLLRKDLTRSQWLRRAVQEKVDRDITIGQKARLSA